MIRKIFFTAVAILLLSCSDDDVESEWMSYTTSDGLADNFVTVIKVDPENRVWFCGGSGGVTSFDGSAWTTYNAADGFTDKKINDLDVRGTTELWFGTEWEGLYKFDGTVFFNPQISNYVKALDVDDDGGVWFANSANDVHYYSGETIERFNLGKHAAMVDDANAIYIDSKGLVWVGTDLSGIFSYDGNDWKEYPLSAEYNSSYIFDITEDRSGALWAVSYLFGVFKLEGETWVPVYTDDSMGYRDIAVDLDNRIWVATTDGVMMFDGIKQQRFTEADGLVNFNVLSVAVDHENNVWIGTAQGVSKYIQNNSKL